MDADERDICNYLKSWPGEFVFGRDVARRAAGKHRFREDPEWAEPVLARLVERGILEADATGHYRLRAKKEQSTVKKWVSPHIKKILNESGKDFTDIYKISGEDEDEVA
jgi:hypothetical protein